MLTTITQGPHGEGFKFGPHFIRIVRDFITDAGTKEEIGFVATDLAKALDRGDGRQVTRALDPDQKGLHLVQTPGGIQSLTVVSESGLYRIVLRSDKPQAEPLMDVVTRQILPALRKTGTYSVAGEQLPGGKPALDVKAACEVYMLFASALPAIGVEPGIAFAQAATSIEETTGISMAHMRQALPATKSVIPTLNATEMGKRLGGLSAKAANRQLRDAGLQSYDGSQWQLTEAGKKHGEAKPYARNGHTGHQLLWRPSALDVLIKQAKEAS